MFELAAATKIVEKDTGIYEAKRYEVADGLKITLPFECQEDSISIYGMAEADTAAAGKFAVAITAAGAEKAGETVITFAEGDYTPGDIVRVGYRRRVVNAAVVGAASNATTVKGELNLHWPVYSSGTDCTESSIKGYLHLQVYRVRATALPGFDNSYKSASTNSITFAGIDPKRADGKMYQLVYEPLDADGNIVNMSDAAVEW